MAAPAVAAAGADPITGPGTGALAGWLTAGPLTAALAETRDTRDTRDNRNARTAGDPHDCRVHHRPRAMATRPRHHPAVTGVLILAMVMAYTVLLLALHVPAEAVLAITAAVCVAAVRARHGLLGTTPRVRTPRPAHGHSRGQGRDRRG
jgi:hypothetical protein